VVGRKKRQGLEWSRAIVLAGEGDEAAQRTHFVVRFQDESAAEIAEAYAITDKGELFGSAQ